MEAIDRDYLLILIGQCGKWAYEQGRALERELRDPFPDGRTSLECRQNQDGYWRTICVMLGLPDPPLYSDDPDVVAAALTAAPEER